MKQRIWVFVGVLMIVLFGCKDRQTPSNAYEAPAPLVGPSQTLDVPEVYPTIQQAVDAARSGDFIRVAEGVYVEDVTVNNKALSLRGAGVGETVIMGIVTIEDSSEASFEGFTVEFGKVVVIRSMARVSGNEILYSPGPGLRLESCAGSIISDNTIKGSTNEGILSDESDGVIGENEVLGNGTDGIVVNNASPTLQRNYVADNRRDGIAIRGFGHYAAPILINNEAINNGGMSNYDIICFGDNTNPTGSANIFGDCINCAECRSMDSSLTYNE